MALFCNPGVNRRVILCDVPEYATVQILDFLNPAKNRLIPDGKLARTRTAFSGWTLGTKVVPAGKSNKYLIGSHQ